MEETYPFLIEYDTVRTLIYAENLSAVLDFISFNQEYLFGHDGIRHLDLKINEIDPDDLGKVFGKFDENVRHRVATAKLMEIYNELRDESGEDFGDSLDLDPDDPNPFNL